MTRTILMDYDGTIHDSDTVLKKSLDGIIDLPGEEFFQIWTYKIHRGLIHTEYLEHHDDVIFHCKLFFRYLKKPYDHDIALLINRKMKEAKFKAKSNPIYFPDAVISLENLKEMGTNLCLSTGVDAREKERTMRKYTGKEFFNHIFSERGIGYLKTEPEYYIETLRRAKAKPEDTYSIGDTPLSDIRPAKLTGIGTIWINRRNEPIPRDHEQIADFQATTLKEAVKHIKSSKK
jgi:FMN phosphatase YigB (HAD superfamily)